MHTQHSPHTMLASARALQQHAQIPKNASLATDPDVEIIGDVNELRRHMTAVSSEQDSTDASPSLWDDEASADARVSEREGVKEDGLDARGRARAQDTGNGVPATSGVQTGEHGHGGADAGGLGTSSRSQAAKDTETEGGILRALCGLEAAGFGGDGGESTDDSWPCSNCGEYNCEEKSAFWKTAQPQPMYNPRFVLVPKKKKNG